MPDHYWSDGDLNWGQLMTLDKKIVTFNGGTEYTTRMKYLSAVGHYTFGEGAPSEFDIKFNANYDGRISMYIGIVRKPVHYNSARDVSNSIWFGFTITNGSLFWDLTSCLNQLANGECFTCLGDVIIRVRISATDILLSIISQGMLVCQCQRLFSQHHNIDFHVHLSAPFIAVHAEKISSNSPFRVELN